MDKISLRIATRQLLATAEHKLYHYKNDVIIREYCECVKALRMAIEASTFNRKERAKLLALLTVVAPTTFPLACKHDTESLKRRLEEIKRSIPSLI